MLIALIAGVALAPGVLLAQDLPVPPCAGTPVPAAGAIDESLNQHVWMDEELPESWQPPACTGWKAGPTKVLLAAAGRLELDADSDELAARLARISALTDIVYWSSTRSRWRGLFKRAVALSEPNRKATREDFTADDFFAGAELNYWIEEDNPMAGVVYRMEVRERTSDRLVFETVNVSTIRASLLLFRARVARPGEFRQLYFLERETDDVWRYYTLVRLGEGGSLVGTSAANYRNRAEAYFRYLAGLDMTREPPAAP